MIGLFLSFLTYPEFRTGAPPYPRKSGVFRLTGPIYSSINYVAHGVQPTARKEGRVRDIDEMKKKADRAPYAKPEITTLSTEQIMEELGPASAGVYANGNADGHADGPFSPG